MKYVITGAAGFIGFHLAKELLKQDNQVVGIDNVNDYYSPALKEVRLKILKDSDKFTFYKADISDSKTINKIFKNHCDSDYLIHLAAQAGVRYSLENPLAYANSNMVGQVVIFDAAYRNLKVPQIVYASSSSVYGNQEKTPFSVDDRVDNPVSLYAATKKSCELIAESFSHTHNIFSTGLRFFTVYGPYGRPEMAYFSFSDNILASKPIKLFNNGNLKRDFTYIDDIVLGIISATHRKKIQKHEVFNLGNNKPVELKYFVEVLENALDKKAVIEYLPMQKGDVYQTYADISLSEKELNYHPKTTIEAGLDKFVEWYRGYRNF